MKRGNELQAGVFIMLALATLAAMVFTLGREKQIFADQEEYFATFTDVKGLAEGAPVRLGGISIGRVADIHFSKDLSDPRVHVTMLINERYLERIREDTLVGLESQGLLGDRFLSMGLGESGKQLLPGTEIKSHETGDIAEVLSKAGKVVENAAEISESINVVLKRVEEQTLEGLTNSVNNIADISNEIREGKGLVHRLIYSEKDGHKILEGLDDASEALGNVLKKVETGDGLLHALIYDEHGAETVGALTTAATNLADTATHISILAEEIQTGDGLLHDIVYTKSPEGLEEIIRKLNDMASNLKEVSERLAEGSGTLGALLVDSQLYDNIVEVTDGAKRSFILRHAIRSSMKEQEG